MADRTIRVSADNWRRLKQLKRPDESMDDLITRLTTADRWDGFGAVEDAGIGDEMDEVRDRFESELRRDLDERDT